MKKNLYKIFISALGFMTVSGSTFGQNKMKEADQQFELFNYKKAILLYEQAYKKKAEIHSAERLAISYRLINDYKQAESWYAILVKMPESNTENLLDYAKTLQNNAKYSEAKAQYLNYFGKHKQVPAQQQNILLLSCDSALIWMKDPKQLEIINQKTWNSAQSDWAAISYQGNVVFSSDRSNFVAQQNTRKPFLKFDGTVWPDKKVYGWTGNGYLKLYSTAKGTDELSLFNIPTGTNYHQGSISFSADENTAFFALTQLPKRLKRSKGKPATIHVEIYSSSRNASGNWSKPIPFTYNNASSYSVADPFISPDGKTLYFSSNMPGGLGGSDIYSSTKTEDGSWTTPLNMTTVNTAGNERSPVLGLNGEFFFSSDGRVGMGGLDIYKARLKGSSADQIENLKYPLNSPQDDFGFSLNDQGSLVFLSSNRFEGLGQDDIYSLKARPVIQLKLIGQVLDKKTQLPIANSLVALSKIDGGILKVETDATGRFKFDLSPESSYTLVGVKTGFLADIKELNTLGLTSSTVIEKQLYLEKIELNKAIRIDNIYYDFDKWNIRPDAAIELDKLVKVLKDNPSIWIELGSHTDSRGKDTYNLNLSQKRAESAIQYIISRGIDQNRLTARGYGETQLVNRCSNGVECSVEEHQENRRTEFKIVKF
ncbi:OmpA family protein [Pedobacter gandavensis]|uniref:OmpA family protein n=1 Tax=Pedobacter gandavensis TaxID=2679963 RepID=A0ABR6F1J4_9SPHI|nr:OmpA family protein [Pedobacter gandavensis]MBB2151403.1 OmpA family protein [Pedobacter gandavensis]